MEPRPPERSGPNDAAIVPSEQAKRLLRSSRPSDDGEDDDVAESDRTLLRPDGTFETTRTLLSKVERSASARADASSPPAADEELKKISEATRPPIALDPEDREGEGEGEEPPKKKTALYGRDDVELPPKPGATVVPPSRDSKGTETEAEAKTKTKAARDEDSDEEPSTTPRLSKPRRAERKAEPSVVPEPTQERSSSRGWVWLVLIVGLAAGGFGAYRAGLLDGVLGGGKESTTVAASDGKRPGDGLPPGASGAVADGGAEPVDDGTPAMGSGGPEATSAGAAVSAWPASP